MRKVKLGDVVELLDSKRIPVSSAERSGRAKAYPYYGAQGIVDYIDDYLFDGDYVLVAEDGNNLKSLSEPIVTWATGKFWVNNHAHILGDSGRASLRYLYYKLMTSDLRGLITGSAQPKLNQENLASFEVALPDKDAQEAAARILGEIDDKIANNKKLMAELEQTAQLIYDYWFTQFDFPDENGKPYRSSGGKMVWNDQLKREIPEGWDAVSIQKVCQVVDCLHSKKPAECRESNQSFLLQLDNLGALGMLNLGWKYYVSNKDYELWTSKIRLRDGDMVITNAGRVGGMARIGEGIEAGMGRNMTAIRPLSIPAMFMWYSFRSPELKRQIANNTDSGSFFGSLNVAGIKLLKFVLPPADNARLLQRFSNYAEPLRRHAEALQQESLSLGTLRDWLLPMLMNGQVTVSE